MALYTSEEVYYAAEAYLSCLPEGMQVELKALLEKARCGQKCDNAILALLAKNDQARAWMAAALMGESQGVKDYTALQGEIGPIETGSQHWVCPKCNNFEWRPPKAGRTPPPCPHCGAQLVPAQGKEQPHA